ncbi:hypothetical protein HanRHA438_Chr10g0440201 [Helianthus annuus]|nr:hypothetical protein HanOQP8_Chr10g0355871 [Helianthus annuus]KAJ0878472.1 hypothetical protein HanRHA438_Chr10g0440201 [Helianthus annuus]KAJ0882714.1 hypothetical protein HanPSC8_Chr10g0412911 [Helianthus annuus]
MSFDRMGVIENIENTSFESVKKSDKSSTLMESKNSDLCPITPYLTEEKVKVTSRLNEDLSTPVEDVFDMCVSGSNQKNNLGTSAAKKKLVFSSNEYVSENECENGSLMETVYESVLEDIICKQAEDILAEILVSGTSRDVLKTPPSAARADGLVETCPGAPMKRKQVRNKRTVDMNLCRKLDFDSCV